MQFWDNKSIKITACVTLGVLLLCLFIVIFWRMGNQQPSTLSSQTHSKENSRNYTDEPSENIAIEPPTNIDEDSVYDDSADVSTSSAKNLRKKQETEIWINEGYESVPPYREVERLYKSNKPTDKVRYTGRNMTSIDTLPYRYTHFPNSYSTEGGTTYEYILDYNFHLPIRIYE